MAPMDKAAVIALVLLFVGLELDLDLDLDRYDSKCDDRGDYNYYYCGCCKCCDCCNVEGHCWNE